MELSTFIPNKNDSNWIVKGDFLMYFKYNNIPVAYIDGNIVYVFLDFKIVKQVSRLIKSLVDKNVEFYFESPEFSNPSADASEYYKKVVTHYLFSYADKNVFKELNHINFDLINNMVRFCDKNNCYDMIKPCYEKVKKSVLNSTMDYYSNKLEYDYPKEIREEFENLYRDIQINKII